MVVRDDIAKKRRGRRILMHPDLRRALERLARTTAPVGPVIRSYRSGHLTANRVVNWFVALFQERGCQGCSSHSGRRSLITVTDRNIHRSGCSLHGVRLLAGRRCIETTERYIDGDTWAQRQLLGHVYEHVTGWTGLPSQHLLPTMRRPPGTVTRALGRTMPTRASPPPATDEQVRALLEKYKCPVPFHEVRTRFLGNIASPNMSASPIKVVQDLWGGELPPFDAIDEANELIGALVMGLWNRLTRHQDRSSPFRLLRMEARPTRASLAALAQMRRQELDGFVEGLFGHEEMIDLPERAHRGLDDLGQMRALFEAVVVLAVDDAKPVTDKGMETTLRHMREMTRNAEHQIHAVVLACTRARRQMLAGMPTSKPTVH